MIFVEIGSGLTLLDTLKNNSGQYIQVNLNSNPEVNDWNEDGKKDLIIGEQSPVSPSTGNIRVYLNIGTNVNPVFNTYSLITSGGSQIYHYRANPRVFDLDQDGKKDLIVGCDDGMLYFYKNNGTNANPVFSGYTRLQQQSGTYIDAYYGSRFCFTDWRGDGDPDILISGYDGYIEYYENTKYIGVEERENRILTDRLKISPNPARDYAIISYSLAKSVEVRIDVYSADGRFIDNVIHEFGKSGWNRYMWNLRDNAGNTLNAGVYFVKFTAGSDIHTTRLLVIR